GGGVADLGRLVVAVEVAVADHHRGPGARGHRLGVDGILAWALALLEAGGVPRQRPRPEGAVLNQHVPCGPAVGVELHGVARDIIDFAVADGDVGPAAGDAVGVLLVLVSAGQEVVDLAVLNDHVPGEDADAVARGVADFAVAQRDLVG